MVGARFEGCALIAAVLATACFSDGGGDGAADAGSDSTSGTAGSTGTSGTTVGTSSGSSSSSGSGETGGSTGPGQATCGDGVRSEGEVCYLDHTVEVMNVGLSEAVIGRFLGGQQSHIAFARGQELRVLEISATGQVVDTHITPLGDVVVDIAVADFDADGDDDVVVAYVDGVQILDSAGDGTFAPGPRMAPMIPINVFFEVIVGDFDPEDPSPDVAVADAGASITLHFARSQTDGTHVMDTSQNLFAGAEANFTSAEVNMVAGWDLLSANNAMDAVTFRAGDPAGGFAAGGQNFPVSGVIRGVALGQLNGDRRLDFVAASQNATAGDLLPVLSEDVVYVAAPEVTAGDAVQSPVITNIDSDSNGDIAAVSSTSVVVVLGNGSGGFSPPFLLPVQDGSVELDVGDLNNDTVPDFVTLGLAGLSITLSNP